MTQPVEDIEKATRRMMECATEWHLFPDSFPLLHEIKKCLTTLLAERDAELQRLRLAAQSLVELLDKDVSLPVIFNAIDVDLRAALRPNHQESSE